MEQNQKGSISVFLSLILLLILAVIMTTIEAARVNVAKVYAERALITAMDSVLAEYYLPLFEEYHIFALDSGYGTEDIQKDTITTNVESYMEYTFEPSKELYLIKDYIPFHNFNLFQIHTTNLEINKMNTIMDYNGEIFAKQAVSYMKYQEIGDGLEGFLQKLSVLKGTEVAQKVLIEKQKTEESLYSIDKEILSLMAIIDGITITEKGIKTNNDGKIIIKGNFIKKICILPATKKNVGIDNELVFSSLSNCYVQPVRIIESANVDIDSIFENLTLINSARIKHLFLTLIDQSEMKDKEELNELKDEIVQAKEQLDYYNNREETLLSSLNGKIASINELVNGTLGKIQSAMPILDELIVKQSNVTEKIVQYEKILLENQEFLSDDFFQGLKEDLLSMKKYKKDNTVMDGTVKDYNFHGMKDTLLKNEAILLELQNSTKFTVAASETSLNVVEESLLHMKTSFGQFSHENLYFDYSTLQKPAESEDFFNFLNSLLDEGIMGLLFEDLDNISEKEMPVSGLPTSLYQIHSSSDPIDVSSILSTMNLKSELGSLTELFNHFGEDFNVTETVLNGADTVGNILLFQEYLLEHFGSYQAQDMEDSIPALNYELEYILMGKTTDYNNLKAVIMRILLIRTLMNVITLMGDTKSSGEARVMAIGFVGFTGLPALVTIMKTTILAIWAFAESLIDVAALLQGKTIPLLKKGIDVQLDIHEVFRINKVFIKSKVARMKESKALMDLTYHDYLRIFLYIEGQAKKSYRALDLIQENIQIKYEDTFYIKNCLYGFQVDAEYQMRTKFVTLPFVNKMTGNEKNTYVFYSRKEYSY